MRLLLILLLAPVLTAQSLDWSLGLPAARAVPGKPLLVFWVAGTQSSQFSQDLDKVFSAWPEWTRQLAAQVVPTRLRSWETKWPADLPPFPGDGKASFVGLLGPRSWLATWTSVPTVLDFSHSAGQAGLTLDEPYSLNMTEVVSSGTVFVRQGMGPLWLETTASKTTEWTEDGPVADLVMLHAGASKVALPREDGWSFRYDSVTQTWSPWIRVLVKHP